MKKMRKKLISLLMIGILLLSACQNSAKQKETLNFTSIKDIAIFTLGYNEKKTGELIYENILVNVQHKENKSIDTENINFNDISSPGEMMSKLQYYKDRLIIGSLSGGGKSIELIERGDQQLEIKIHNFNIVFYDEAQQKYISQSRESENPGFYILDSNLKQLDFIPVPVSPFDKPVAVFPYNLDTFLYVGDYEDEKFQVYKFNFSNHAWEKVTQLLPPSVYAGYEGYAYMSYNEKYPDWATFTINSLYSENLPLKEINKLFFVNLKNGEIRKTDLPLHSQNSIMSMPYMDKSIMKSKDRVVVLDMNPDGVKVLEELYVEDLVPYGEQHINSVDQYTDEYMILSTPDGLVKYTFATESSEYIYTAQVKD